MYVPIHNFRDKDTLESGNPLKIIKGDEVQTELEAISAATRSLEVCACKFNGTEIKYEYNVASVNQPKNPVSGKYDTCRVTFKNLIPEFDWHYASIVQPYATHGKHVIATITNQNDEFCEWVWLQFDFATQVWDAPAEGPTGFSFAGFDIEIRD